MEHFLLDPADCNDVLNPVLDQSFLLWKEIFSFEIESRGSKFNPDAFWNARLLSVIKNEEGILGLHIYNSHNIDNLSAQYHSYYQDLSDGVLRFFRQNKIRSLMTMEYLLVNPKFRGKSGPCKISELILGLGARVLRDSPWDCAVGVARVDRGVNSSAAKIGMKELEDVTKNQTPCKIVYVQREKTEANPDPFVQSRIDSLWANKTNASRWVTPGATPARTNAA